MEAIFGRALEYLKASGWQTAMIAAAAGLFLYLSKDGVLPSLSPILELTVWAVLFLSAALAAASLASWLQGVVAAAWRWQQQKRSQRILLQSFRKHVPYLTAKERQILGYLLAKKQKAFTADHDGGYAGTLIAQGFVHYIGVRGQSVDMDKCPFRVAEHVWQVMEESPGDFSYVPEFSDRHPRVETEPWRIPWELR